MIAILFFLFVCLYIFRYFSNYLKFYNYARKIPGPKMHGILGNVPDLMDKTTENLGEVLKFWANEQRGNGSRIMRVFLFGNLFVWPLDGEMTKVILENNEELDKGEDYRFFEPWIGKGLLLEPNIPRWKSHRKLIQPVFNFSKLPKYFEIFKKQTEILIDILHEKSSKSEFFDIFPHIKFCLLDIVADAALGIQTNSQIRNFHEYIDACEEFSRILIEFSFKPWLRNPIFYKFSGFEAKIEENLRVLKDFSMKFIKERRADVEFHKDQEKCCFLDHLLDSPDLTDEEIREEIDTLIFGGHDTTTSSVAFALWNIAHNPDVQNHIYQEELQENPLESREDFRALKYLDRVLKESKRLTPPIPFFQRKLRKSLKLLDQCEIPAGSTISIGPIILHSNPEVFKNPGIFDPDRFLPDEVSKRSAFDFVPFSAGIRNCVGQNFGLLNEKVIVAKILKEFEVLPGEDYGFTVPCLEVSYFGI